RRDPWTLVFALWLLAGLAFVGLLAYSVSQEQGQIDRLYDVVNSAKLSQAELAANESKLDSLATERSFLASALWISMPLAVVAPALGYLWLLARRRLAS
ncbi:MAG TPA: hypothetical protein VN694_06085, partial [Caulobacteraceae bacterium]|nr:hypothetical protein [Caulobacteraceae bacterium]